MTIETAATVLIYCTSAMMLALAFYLIKAGSSQERQT